MPLKLSPEQVRALVKLGREIPVLSHKGTAALFRPAIPAKPTISRSKGWSPAKDLNAFLRQIQRRL